MQLAWALMAAWQQPLDLEWELAEITGSWLKLAARNQTKPGRDNTRELLVLHADSTWTEAHWESSPEQIAELMLAEFRRVLEREFPAPEHAVAHRWKFATPLPRAESPVASGRCLTSACDSLIACGDWTSGPGVEAAFLAGAAAAGRILNRLQPTSDFFATPVQTRLF
jgi:predicted NAD/FAD-dependent oxidoreductase